MKIVKLKTDAVIDGVLRRAGQVVQVADDYQVSDAETLRTAADIRTAEKFHAAKMEKIKAEKAKPDKPPKDQQGKPK